jgi:hypothetical protein
MSSTAEDQIIEESSGIIRELPNLCKRSFLTCSMMPKGLRQPARGNYPDNSTRQALYLAQLADNTGNVFQALPYRLEFVKRVAVLSRTSVSKHFRAARQRKGIGESKVHLYVCLMSKISPRAGCLLPNSCFGRWVFCHCQEHWTEYHQRASPHVPG